MSEKNRIERAIVRKFIINSFLSTIFSKKYRD